MIKALKKAGYSRKERKEFLEGTTGFADASVIAGEMLDGTLSQKQIDALNSSLYAAQESGLLVKNKIGTIYDTSLPFVRNDENDYTWVTTQYGFDLLNGRIREHNALDMVVNTPSDGRYETGTTKLIVPETSDITLSYGKDIGLKETFTFGEGNQIYYGHMDENSVTSYLAQFGTEGVSITSSGHLHNVPGGMLTGYVGNTGAVTTNPHLHLGYSTLEFNQENLEFNMVSTNPNEYFSSLQNIAVTPYAQVTSGLQGINSINDNLNLSHVMNYYQFVNNPNQNYNNHYNFDDFYSSYSSHMNSSAFTTATIMYLYNQRRSVR